MNRLDRLLHKMEAGGNQKLKSEEVFDKYLLAKNELDKNMTILSEIIEKLNQEQLDILNFKDNH